MAVPEVKPALSAKHSSASFCRHCTSPLEETHRYCPACGAAASRLGSSADPLIGRTIAGTYAIRELIGVGGMGRIYRAEQTSLGRSVAVKVVNPQLLTHEAVVARFYREARAASALNHPNSVSVIDFGRTDDGVLYLVMELLRGRDLSVLLEDEGLPTLDRACRIMIDVLSALDEAHAASVVHRDLKPANIFVEQRKSGRDLVKVVDFGIATLASEPSSSVTLPGLLCGTPDYMSPEQVSGGVLDGRSDIYAAGAVLFELLTGQPLFAGATPSEIATRHVNTAPPDPRVVAPHRDIPDALADIVARALEKQADARYATASDMADALQDILQALGPRTRRISGEVLRRQTPVSSPSAETQTATPVPAPPAPRLDGAPDTDGQASSAKSGRLIGRDAELVELQQLLAQARAGAVFAQVIGEPGVGKTRLLQEFARAARAVDHAVIEVGAHPSGAPVAYQPLRTLLAALLATNDEGIARHAAAVSDPIVRAGLLEVLGRRSSTRGLRLPREQAVTLAVAAVLAESAQAASEPLLIVFEDAHQYDGSTLAVLAALPARIAAVPVLACTSAPERQAALGPQRLLLTLDKLTRAQAYACLGSRPAASEPPAMDAPLMLPLYLEQLRALGCSLRGVVPRDLGDAVAQRTDRLSPSGRRALQAAAILGVRSARTTLYSLIGDGASEAVDELLAVGMLRVSRDELELEHPYLRDFVEASMPATARTELHALALKVLAQAPLEVRAMHAAKAGQLLNASMLLQEMASSAATRGDTKTALLGFHCGWNLAQKESALGSHPVVAGVLTRMARGLAAALVDSGDFAGAEGVLREQLAQCDADGQQRISVLVDLGDVVMRRGRRREAHDLLVQALLTASAAGAREFEAMAHMTLAELKRHEGDARGQVESLMAAHQLFAQLGTHAVLECVVALRLGAAMQNAGDIAGSISALVHAKALAKHAPELAAHAQYGCMLGEAARRNTAAAIDAGREARRLAAESGDLELAERIDDALTRLVIGKAPEGGFEPNVSVTFAVA